MNIMILTMKNQNPTNLIDAPVQLLYFRCTNNR